MVIDQRLCTDDIPEYLCGGANRKPKRKRRRLTRAGKPPSERKARKVKPGGRVRRQGAFKGEGNQLETDPTQSSFRKRTQSKNAVDQRLQAAEKRARHDARRKRGEPSDTEESVTEEEEVDELVSTTEDESVTEDEAEEFKSWQEGLEKDERRELELERARLREDFVMTSGGTTSTTSTEQTYGSKSKVIRLDDSDEDELPDPSASKSVSQNGTK